MQQLSSTGLCDALTAMYGTISGGCLCPFYLHAPLLHSVWVALQPCRTCTGAGNMLCWLKSCSGSEACAEACSAATRGSRPQADIKAHLVVALLANTMHICVEDEAMERSGELQLHMDQKECIYR